jgi:hypothetical protein
MFGRVQRGQQVYNNNEEAAAAATSHGSRVEMNSIDNVIPSSSSCKTD